MCWRARCADRSACPVVLCAIFACRSVATPVLVPAQGPTPPQREEESATSTSQECRKLAADYARRWACFWVRCACWREGEGPQVHRAPPPARALPFSSDRTAEACRGTALHALPPCATTHRVSLHGARKFRWPDGSLRPEAPPPNPYAVVSPGPCRLVRAACAWESGACLRLSGPHLRAPWPAASMGFSVPRPQLAGGGGRGGASLFLSTSPHAHAAMRRPIAGSGRPWCSTAD